MRKILIGIDIGNDTIKAVQLQREKTQIALLAAGYLQNPISQQNSTTVGAQEEQLIAKSINHLIHDMKVSTMDTSISLSSSKVLTRVISIPLVTEKELLSSVQWEAEQYIPWPLTKVKLDYVILEKNPNLNKMKVLLVAAPTLLIEQYQNIIFKAGLNVVAVETEILSAIRSIQISLPQITNYIILNFGATFTDIGIINSGIIEYNKSIPIGSATFTKAIMDELGFDYAQAEEYKKIYGLDETKLDGKLNKILFPLLETVIKEIDKISAYAKQEFPGVNINNIILNGGLAKLPGLVISLTKSIGIDSQITNPFINIAIDKNIQSIIQPDATLYTTAVGLAEKDI
jgi:type IV pilus assembly protein PilM